MRPRALVLLLATSLVAVLCRTSFADEDLADSIVCPVLAVVFPPEGDLPCRDCPPYGNVRQSSQDDDECVPVPEQAPPAHVSIHRFPVATDGTLGGALLIEHPGAAYECWDIHTGRVVAQGDSLAMPNPGVACDPILPSRSAIGCSHVGAGGSHADSGLGVVVVTSACSTFAASHAMTIPAGSGTRTSASGNGTTTWRCTVSESFEAQLPITDYWVYCDINVP